jgi:hypothetical protein
MIKYYILFLPFTHAFAISGILPLPLIVLISIFLISILTLNNNIKIYFDAEDLFLFLFLFLVLVSFIFSFYFNQHIEYKTVINHLLSYIITIVLMYFFLKTYILSYAKKNTFKTILKYITISVFISSLIGIFEFIDKNFLHYGIDEFIYRPTVKDMPALFNLFYRMRSFTEEPGHFGLFLEIFSPLSLYYIFNSNIKVIYAVIFSFTVLISLIFTFSTASFVIIPISIFITLAYFLYKNNVVIKQLYFYKRIIYILFSLILFFILLDYIGFISFLDLVETAVKKITNSSSSSDRLERASETLNVFYNSNIIQLLFGFGPAGNLSYNLNSVVSLYVTILFEVGILGIILFILFLLVVFKKIISIKSNIKYFFMISFISATLHYSIISNYWFPWLWFLIVLIAYVKRYERIHNFIDRNN